MDELLITRVSVNYRKYKMIVFMCGASFESFFLLQVFSIFHPFLQLGAAPLKIWRMVNSP